MIVRVWNGKVLKDDAEAYQKYLMNTGVADCKNLAGNNGVQLLCRRDEHYAFFTVMTYWESIDHIKKYAGNDISQAKYYADDEKYLVDIDCTVNHYSVVYSDFKDTKSV
ncbi:hypothetical protein [Pseudomonas panipatensis]|uniref:Antibiotic biosynthesis monooxygenase n=1 Tax=Pseudomonas panipatensis TaxID=428992 RepID=A0A1G8FQD3_9PSED|nr:hypothetical protein [Pseudomonas panipatensis]SDH84383.1 hypothetical protein SAMN05216272_103391 [Pseudomonas panipatensis]SMP52628.1 hypothetical protein SAMN06295951_10368 [Pseudomonas panipatensis]